MYNIIYCIVLFVKCFSQDFFENFFCDLNVCRHTIEPARLFFAARSILSVFNAMQLPIVYTPCFCPFGIHYMSYIRPLAPCKIPFACSYIGLRYPFTVRAFPLSVTFYVGLRTTSKYLFRKCRAVCFFADDLFPQTSQHKKRKNI